ncbi:MAG: choice-of-anchor Q domain-containing protein, partial [Anaerolineae bacterium]
VVFKGNKAGWGGGFYQGRGSATLTNVLYSGNMAGWAGGILVDQGTITLTHTTFSGNNGYNVGGGLQNYAGTATIINSIFWGNSATNGPEIYNQFSATTTVVYSDIKFTGVYTGTGNINADPLFAAPINASGAPTSAGNYRLRAGSPAIDHGINAGVTTDLDGLSRPVGAGFDMGAYEYRPMIYIPLVMKQ